MTDEARLALCEKALRETYNTLLQIYDTLSGEEQRAFDIGEAFGCIKTALHPDYNPEDYVQYMRGGAENEPDTV